MFLTFAADDELGETPEAYPGTILIGTERLSPKMSREPEALSDVRSAFSSCR